MQSLKTLAQGLLRKAGYTLQRTDRPGMDAFQDMRRWITAEAPMLFDVGANRGQTIHKFRDAFPRATIHAFEPAPEVYRALVREYGDPPITVIHQCALGVQTEVRQFHENAQSELSSLLQPTRPQWAATLTKPREVYVTTVDDLCMDNGITRLDVLKLDTQGFDLMVLMGARRMLSDRRVSAVYLEVNFADLYRGQGSFGAEYDLLVSHGFRLVSFYDLRRNDAGLAEWADALFVLEEKQ